MAAVFVGTLLTYLVVTAVPAFAVSTCDTVATGGVAQFTGTLELRVNVGADDKVVIRVNAGAYEFSQNGGAFAACGATAGAPTQALVAWVNVIGSDAGAETLTLFNPPDIPTGGLDVVSVALGNGSDTLILEYGALASPATVDPAPGVAATVNLGQAGTTGVGDTNGNGNGDLKITNAETIVINGDNTAADTLNAGNVAGIAATTTIDTPVGTGVTGDDVPASPAGNPFAAALTLNGLGGDDNLVSGNGNDNFQGGPGADGVSYVGASGAVVVDLTAATGTGMGADTLTDVQNATGGPFNDTITGNTLNNVLNGGNGNDTLDALTGDDTLNGDAGDDTLNEGVTANGADTLNGGSGGPEVNGDTLNYGARTTALVVRPGAGPVSGADANADGDAADATDERDTVANDIENFTLGSAADTFVGSGNAEFVTPGAGNDSVDGGVAGEAACTDVIDESDQTGPAVFDLAAGTAVLGTQTDTFKNIEGVSGTDGDDTVIWNGTSLVPAPGGGALHAVLCVFGGDGNDTVDASTATRGVTLDLTLLFGGAALNADIENAIGGSGNDTLNGNILANRLIGNDGNDTINAGGGNDFVEGGQGNDTLNPGGGADTLSYRNAPSGVLVDNQLGFSSGGDGDDALGGVFPIILGSDFNDEIIAGQTSLDLNQRIKGRKGNDVIVGSNSSDLLVGAGGNDSIRAGGGDDDLKGGAGDDLLVGSSGDDNIRGGKGPDTAIGGRGFDLCVSAKTQSSCEA